MGKKQELIAAIKQLANRKRKEFVKLVVSCAHEAWPVYPWDSLHDGPERILHTRRQTALERLLIETSQSDLFIGVANEQRPSLQEVAFTLAALHDSDLNMTEPIVPDDIECGAGGWGVYWATRREFKAKDFPDAAYDYLWVWLNDLIGHLEDSGRRRSGRPSSSKAEIEKAERIALAWNRFKEHRRMGEVPDIKGCRSGSKQHFLEWNRSQDDGDSEIVRLDCEGLDRYLDLARKN